MFGPFYIFIEYPTFFKNDGSSYPTNGIFFSRIQIDSINNKFNFRICIIDQLPTNCQLDRKEKQCWPTRRKRNEAGVKQKSLQISNNSYINRYRPIE